MNAVSHVLFSIALLGVLASAAGCGSCFDADPGEPWSVDASEADTRDASEADTHDASEVDTEDGSKADTHDGSEVDTEDASEDAAPDTTADTSNADADASDPLACLETADTECPTQDPNSYGDCAMPLGVVFDGDNCVPASGCGCEGDECPRFDSLPECAQECVGAGACTEDEMPIPAYGSTPMTCSTGSCGETLTFCVAADSNPVAQIEVLFPDQGVACAEDGRDCELAAAFEAPECPDGDWCCSTNGGFGDEQLARACAAALLPGVQQGACYSLE